MKSNKLGVLLVNDMVLFPGAEIRFEIDNLEQRQIISVAEATEEKEILVVNPIENNLDSLDITMLPTVGVVASLKLKMDIPNGKTKIVLKGLRRVKVDSYYLNNSYYEATTKKLVKRIDKEDEAMYRDILIKGFDKYIENVPYVSNAIMAQLKYVEKLEEMTDMIANFLPISYDKKKKYILESSPILRTTMLIEDMNDDIKYVELERKIEQEVEKELNDTQKEFFLREKIKTIQKELGDVSSKEDEVERLEKKLRSLKCSKRVKDRIKREIDRYKNVNSNSPELGMIRDYLDWMLNLPWQKYTKDNEDLDAVKHVLDTSHFGLEDVKTRIIEYLAVKQNTNNLKSPIICLVGPPGVGKTSLAFSIAKSLNRKYTKISVGGINDEAEIVGHRRTYVGACPGRIISGIRKAESTNPVFIIDEIDKLRKDLKGDPASSLLEVLDPEQNSKFSDHYIEEEFDLSQVMFIATANYMEQIPLELRDRLEIIELSSYTEYEKVDIAMNYLIPKNLESHGLTELEVQFDEKAILSLIRNYTIEAGVRELERVISSLLRKIVKKLLTDKKTAAYQIDTKKVVEFLGHGKYEYSKPTKVDEVGVVNGLAYTVFGGDVLPIEVTSYKGKGKLLLTGSLGDVMKESAKIALSYIKTNAKTFGIDFKVFEENDIHIHVPEGAVNKDGPSAGITLTTALISLFTNKKVSSDIAMTGEITLRGQILPIGGLKEKIIGAKRNGIKEIFIPKDNKKDLEEIDKELTKSVKFILVDKYLDIYKKIFK